MPGTFGNNKPAKPTKYIIPQLIWLEKLYKSQEEEIKDHKHFWSWEEKDNYSNELCKCNSTAKTSQKNNINLSIFVIAN